MVMVFGLLATHLNKRVDTLLHFHIILLDNPKYVFTDSHPKLLGN